MKSKTLDFLLLRNNLDEKIKKEKENGIYYVKQKILFLCLLPSSLLVMILPMLGFPQAFSFVLSLVFYALMRAILAQRKLKAKNKLKAANLELAANGEIESVGTTEEPNELKVSENETFELEEESIAKTISTTESEEELERRELIRRIKEKQKMKAGEL
ncbi:hypothetical protein [Pseudomonas savastanoi]|uniref:hypothetical protein n=1 Tax=Pseudomonas savastanoi TaxID=29438 RepID=UPI001071CEE8|nr:hypothetical protein [Pseudomonas savastanoi]